MKKRASLAIGVDVGATGLKAAVVDAAGKIVLHARCATGGDEGATEVLDRIALLVGMLSERTGAARVGVGSCGLVDPRTGVVVASTKTMRGWAGTRLRDEVAARTGFPVAVENDGDAAARGESTFGAGRGAPSMVMLTLGTGVGGAFVMDGRVLTGASNMAGKFGHVRAGTEGRPCACGAVDCLEAYASAWALRRAAGCEPDEVFKRARRGDRAMRAHVDAMADALGEAFAVIAHTVNPSRIVIGGGIAASWSRMAVRAKRVFRARAMKVAYAATRIVVAELGADAGMIGASLIAPPLHQTRR